MSAYEDYSEVAKHYDQTRVPVGGEILVGALALANRASSEFRLLDAGCGTGAFSELVLPYAGHIDAMDINPHMLAVAREKLTGSTPEARIAFHLGSIEAMPFDANYFDAVMFNQVLHHLESGDDDNFDGHRVALGEAHRVLRRGGLIFVNCTTHAQLRHGYWYMHLIPTAVETLYNRCIPADKLEAMLEEVGFTMEGRYLPLSGVLQGPDYFNPEGPLKPEWRNAESSWALAPEHEITAALSKLMDLRTEGGLDAYMAEHDGKRPQTGQTAYFVARKL